MLGEKNVRTSFQSRFSIPFGLASIIYHGRSGLAAFEQAAVDNPKIQALAQRVDLSEDESFSKRYPDEQPVTIRITMRGGAVYEGRCVVTKGEPGNPHKAEDLTAKFFDLGVPVWGKQVTQSLYDGLMRLEDITDFRAFADGYKL
jgi:2-methylcitrate dehydratase PrpD